MVLHPCRGLEPWFAKMNPFKGHSKKQGASLLPSVQPYEFFQKVKEASGLSWFKSGFPTSWLWELEHILFPENSAFSSVQWEPHHHPAERKCWNSHTLPSVPRLPGTGLLCGPSSVHLIFTESSEMLLPHRTSRPDGSILHGCPVQYGSR